MDSSPGRITYPEDEDIMNEFNDQGGLPGAWPETLSHQLPTPRVLQRNEQHADMLLVPARQFQLSDLKFLEMGANG